MNSERELVREIESQAEELSRAMAGAEQAYRDLTEKTQGDLAKSLADLRDANQRRVAGLRANHAKQLERQTQTLLGIEKRSGLWTAPWDSEDFESFRPAAGVPAAVRFGSLRFRGPFSEVRTPALLPFTGGRNLVIKASGGAKDDAAAAMESLVLRLLLTIPPAKLKLLLIDPVGLGRHVASLMTLADYSEELVTDQAWVDQRDIEERLAATSDHMETVIQRFLRKRFATMEEYNEEAGEVAEPYRLVVAINFPVNFSQSAARRLVSIARNGPRCGVLTLVTVDTDQSRPHDFVPEDLERDAVVVVEQNGRFVWRDQDFEQGELTLDRPPPPERVEELLQQLGEKAQSAAKVEVPFERIAPTPDSWWSFDTRKGITAPIGRHGATQLQNLELVDDSPHALMVGQTGSGKTTLMHVIITNLALRFSTEEIELYLVDFKEGVAFKHYTPTEGGRVVLPHARVIAIQSEREFGLSCLEALEREMQRRSDLFRDARCEDLGKYRESTGTKMPRVLLLVDEFHRFFEEDDKLASEARRLLGRIARQGRGFGVHLMLATQSLAGSHILPTDIRGQMAVRIAMRCNEADAVLILADDNPAAKHLSRPGEAIYNAGTGLAEKNRDFQVAWLEDDERADLLARMNERFGVEGQERPTTIVFEGNMPARLRENDLLRRELSTEASTARLPRVAAWVGRPVAIKDPTAAVFARRAGRNLLVVGKDEELAVSICVAAMVSLAAQIGPTGLEFELLAMPSIESPWIGIAEDLASVLPHRCSPIRARNIAEPLKRLADLIDERIAGEDFSGPQVFFVGLGLQRARDLREQERGFSLAAEDRDTGPSAHELFIKVLTEGSEVGVHTIGWWDALSSLNRAVSRRNREDFGIRVALALSNDESNQLIDSPAAAKLGALRGLLWDEDRPSDLEKFIPYSLSQVDWKSWVADRLTRKWGAG